MSAPSNGNQPSDEEKMQYGMLGEDGETTQEKLEKYTGEVDWSYLKPHFENEAILWLDASLSLTQVGKALTDDDVEQIEGWKKSGDLVVPSQPHAVYWEDSEATFTALVVSPFVLIQDKDKSE